MKRISRTIHAILPVVALALTVASAEADKVNLTYVEEAPYPIGPITPEQISTMAESEFTHLVFAFVNLCTPTPAETDAFDCPGVKPVPVWNVRPTYDSNGEPFRDAQAAMQRLTQAGKTIYMSVGAADNRETWDYIANASPDERAEVKHQLQKFMSDYSIVGVDFDYEAGDPAGFKVLAELLGSMQPRPLFSSAPYSTDPSANDPVSVQWQYCQFLDAGVQPTLINRQFYSGGFAGNVADSIEADLAPFYCANNRRRVMISQNIMNPGIGVPPQATPSNCKSSQGCANIAKEVVSRYPDIAGISLWNYKSLHESSIDPSAYACAMSDALNGQGSCPMTRQDRPDQ